MIEVFVEFIVEAAGRFSPYSGMHGYSPCEIQQGCDHTFSGDVASLDQPSLEYLARWTSISSASAI